MLKVDLLNQEKQVVGELQLREEVFGVSVNVPLVHQVLKAQLANRRQGTAKTKVKSEVRGGGKKPFKQKGTGNARQGSTRSPLQPGGGQNFGPRPRSYAQDTPKAMVRGALRSMLSDRLRAQRLLFLKDFQMKEAKTRLLRQVLDQAFQVKQVVLVDEKNEFLERSGRNLPHVTVLRADRLNVYDLVKHEWVLMTERAARQIETRLSEEACHAECV